MKLQAVGMSLRGYELFGYTGASGDHLLAVGRKFRILVLSTLSSLPRARESNSETLLRRNRRFFKRVDGGGGGV